MSDEPAKPTLEELVESKRVKPKVKPEEPPIKAPKGEAAGFDPNAKGFSATKMRMGVEWLFENMGSGVKLQDAPSKGWWMYLQALKKDARLRSDFYTNLLPKFIPAKSAGEEGKPQDDGKRASDHLQRLLDRNVAQKHPEGTQAKLALPQGSAEAGGAGQGVA